MPLSAPGLHTYFALTSCPFPQSTLAGAPRRVTQPTIQTRPILTHSCSTTVSGHPHTSRDEASWTYQFHIDFQSTLPDMSSCHQGMGRCLHSGIPLTHTQLLKRRGNIQHEGYTVFLTCFTLWSSPPRPTCASTTRRWTKFST